VSGGEPIEWIVVVVAVQELRGSAPVSEGTRHAVMQDHAAQRPDMDAARGALRVVDDVTRVRPRPQNLIGEEINPHGG